MMVKTYIYQTVNLFPRFMWFMIKVTFGEHDRCDDSMRPETRFVLRAIAQQFSFTNFDNDVALLRLNDRVPITDFIRPICLPEDTGFIFKFWLFLYCLMHWYLYFCHRKSVRRCGGHSDWLGNVEGGRKTVVYSARSRSSNFKQFGLYERNELHHQNDNGQYAVRWLSGSGQEGLLSGIRALLK